MFEELRLEQLVSRIKQSFREFCDVRRGKNKQYDMGASLKIIKDLDKKCSLT